MGSHHLNSCELKFTIVIVIHIIIAVPILYFVKQNPSKPAGNCYNWRQNESCRKQQQSLKQQSLKQEEGE